jgi:hypothetical protein
MKNRSAAFTQNTLLYTKAYRRIAGTVTATILFQRLEYRFSRYPDGFYKFLEPSPLNRRYRAGDSWTEELGFSVDEFRSAFGAMGIRYKSQTEFKAAAEPFKSGAREALYCSVLDKSTGLTIYYRNHILVDRLLDELTTGREAVEEGKPASAEQPEEGGADGNPNLPSVDPHLMNIPHTSEYSSMAHADGTHTDGARARASVSEDKSADENLSRHDFATVRVRDGLVDAEIDRWLADREQAACPVRAEAEEVATGPLPGEPDPDLLARFLAAVERRINRSSFLTWFKPISGLTRDGTQIYIGVPNAVFRDWISDTYFDVIAEVRAELELDGCPVEFLVAGAAQLQLEALS